MKNKNHRNQNFPNNNFLPKNHKVNTSATRFPNNNFLPKNRKVNLSATRFPNNNFLPKNRKADISVTMLVIGIVGILILTILSFVKVSSEMANNFSGIGLIETMNSLNVENNFYKETNFNSDYGGLFNRKGVKITMKKDNMEGIYFLTEQNILRSCDGKSFKLLKKCAKVMIRIDYKNNNIFK